MKPKRIVIALGGNALGDDLAAQYKAVACTSKVIADLIEEGHEVLLTHGNGPQVGMILNAMTAYHSGSIPLSVCVAMSQAYIGYDLQNALREELLCRGIHKSVSTVITQVRVEETDPAFTHLSKPIGHFMGKEEAHSLENRGMPVMEDANRGYRRVVASPKPAEIIEISTIRSLLSAGEVVITCGGGGIPVIRQGNHLKGVAAVIDKDYASCLLAQEIDADILIILTAVEKIALNYGKEDQFFLDRISAKEAMTYASQGHFAPGSMLPKVMAGIAFAQSGQNRKTLITLLEKAKEGIHGETGTWIYH